MNGVHEKPCILLNWAVPHGLKLWGKNLPKRQFHADRVQRCLIKTTSWLLCVLRTGPLMSLPAYCMCESRCVGRGGLAALDTCTRVLMFRINKWLLLTLLLTYFLWCLRIQILPSCLDPCQYFSVQTSCFYLLTSTSQYWLSCCSVRTQGHVRFSFTKIRKHWIYRQRAPRQR